MRAPTVDLCKSSSLSACSLSWRVLWRLSPFLSIGVSVVTSFVAPSCFITRLLAERLPLYQVHARPSLPTDLIDFDNFLIWMSSSILCGRLLQRMWSSALGKYYGACGVPGSLPQLSPIMSVS